MHIVIHNVMHIVMYNVMHETHLRMHSCQYAYCNIVRNCCGPLIVVCITLNMYYEMHIVQCNAYCRRGSLILACITLDLHIVMHIVMHIVVVDPSL